MRLTWATRGEIQDEGFGNDDDDDDGSGRERSEEEEEEEEERGVWWMMIALSFEDWCKVAVERLGRV